MSKYIKFVILLGIVLLIALVGFRSLNVKDFIGSITNPSSRNTNEIQNSDGNDISISCARTSRLENQPRYDRALSLINEKYEIWEKNSGWNSFPSQLTNCIKIIESDVRSTQNVEGYFEFNSNEIKENYFPIYVDKDYAYSDDIVNALLLVHEITHVRQYLDALNGKDDLSCVDKEVEAFYAEWNFYRFQFDETQKSIEFRIKYDEELNTQLQIVKSISDYILSQKFVGLVELCKDESPTNTCSDIIDNNFKRMIKEIVESDSYYRKQCKL